MMMMSVLWGATRIKDTVGSLSLIRYTPVTTAAVLISEYGDAKNIVSQHRTICPWQTQSCRK